MLRLYAQLSSLQPSAVQILSRATVIGRGLGQVHGCGSGSTLFKVPSSIVSLMMTGAGSHVSWAHDSLHVAFLSLGLDPTLCHVTEFIENLPEGSEVREAEPQAHSFQLGPSPPHTQVHSS